MSTNYKTQDPSTLDVNKISDVSIEGIDHGDAMKFCDAFLASGSYDDGDIRGPRPLTDDECEYITENEPDWVYNKTMEQII